jgi:hypothetical protein
MSENKPRYTVIGMTDDNHEIRLYDNGDKRNELGHLLENNGKGNEIITPETARTYHAMRKQKILAAIESKLKDVTKTNAPAEAIAAIVGKRAQIAMTDDTRTGNDAAKIVLLAVDAYQNKTTEQAQITRHEYTVDEETRLLLHAMIQDRRDTHTTDAAIIDTDAEDTER